MDLSSAAVLDLYAGSGALGLEALSRGAGSVTLVESDRNAVNVLRKNVAAVGLPGASVVSGRVLPVLRGGSGAFDLVLLDPPYADSDVDLVLAALQGWTAPDALVLLERSVRSPDPVWPSFLEPLRVKKYGDTAVHWARDLGHAAVSPEDC
jgi:16S rRNA (guanine966-N2)-methyltransferase